MQIDPAAHAGGRAEQSASCWFCASWSPFVQPINVSAVRKGSRGGLFNTKSIEPFSAFLSRWTSWYFWGDFDSLASLQCTSLKISLKPLGSIKKRRRVVERAGGSFVRDWLMFVLHLLPSSSIPWQPVCKFHILISPSHVAARPSHKSTKSGKICKIWWRLLPTFSPAVAKGRLREYKRKKFSYIKRFLTTIVLQPYYPFCYQTFDHWRNENTVVVV